MARKMKAKSSHVGSEQMRNKSTKAEPVPSPKVSKDDLESDAQPDVDESEDEGVAQWAPDEWNGEDGEDSEVDGSDVSDVSSVEEEEGTSDLVSDLGCLS